MHNATPHISEEEKRILARGVVRCFQYFLDPEDGDVLSHYVALAICVGQFDNKRWDLTSLSSFASLPRSTVVRHLPEKSPCGDLRWEDSSRRRVPYWDTSSPDAKERSDRYFDGLRRILHETLAAWDAVDRDVTS